MSSNKKPTDARGISQPFNRQAGYGGQFKPVVAQLKTPVSAQNIKRPVALLVYKPQPEQKVAQPKTAIAQVKWHVSAQSVKHPIAPPVYRPQQAPKVLQTKNATGQSPPAGQAPRQPIAPPVYRPEVKKIVQPKAISSQRKSHSPPHVYRPEQKRIAQPKAATTPAQTVSKSPPVYRPQSIQVNAQSGLRAQMKSQVVAPRQQDLPVGPAHRVATAHQAIANVMRSVRFCPGVLQLAEAVDVRIATYVVMQLMTTLNGESMPKPLEKTPGLHLGVLYNFRVLDADKKQMTDVNVLEHVIPVSATGFFAQNVSLSQKNSCPIGADGIGYDFLGQSRGDMSEVAAVAEAKEKNKGAMEGDFVACQYFESERGLIPHSGYKITRSLKDGVLRVKRTPSSFRVNGTLVRKGLSFPSAEEEQTFAMK